MEKSAKTTAKKPAAKRAAKTAPKTAIKKAASKTAATKKATAKKAAAKKTPEKKTEAKTLFYIWSVMAVNTENTKSLPKSTGSSLMWSWKAQCTAKSWMLCMKSVRWVSIRWRGIAAVLASLAL